MIPPKLYMRVQESRASANAVIEKAIAVVLDTVGVGEWELMAFILLLTLVFHIIRIQSNFFLPTLNMSEK